MRALKITLISFIVIGFIGVATTFIVYGFNVRAMWNDMSSTAGYTEGDRTYVSVTSVSVSAHNGRINFEGHDSDQVKITYHTREGRLYLTTELTNGQLVITQSTVTPNWNFGMMGFRSTDVYAINVLVPRELVAATLTSNNGRINVNGVGLTSLHMGAQNGRIDVSNVTVSGLMHVTSQNGRVNVSDSEITDINITSNNGRIDVSRTTGEEIRLRNSNGRNSISNGTFTIVDVQTNNGRNSVTLIGTQANFEIRFSAHNGTSRLNRTRTSGTHQGGPGSIRMSTHNGRNDLRFV